MDLTREQVAMLAKCERMMDSGEQPYVVCDGGRWAFSCDLLNEWSVVSGQTVTPHILQALMGANLRRLQAEIIAKDAD
jgi:hypothetical protein